MTHVSPSSIFEKNNQDHSDQNKIFTLPFREHDILQLQQIFVTFGLHIIKVPNVVEGRMIIEIILKSLNYYQNIGCVTDMLGLNNSVHDIVKAMKLEKFKDYELLTGLDNFFAVYPCFDFVWVEFTENMKNKYNLEDIKKVFNMYCVNERMPVLIVMYEE